MSEDSRAIRVDAQRSRAAILDAALSVLGREPDASLQAVARAAGVSRQTVYAHFGSREVLFAAVLDHATLRARRAIEDASLDDGPAADALIRFLDATWAVFDGTPGLAHLTAQVPDRAGDAGRHEPVSEQLLGLIRRGQEEHDFDQLLPADWLVTATIALGHAAGEAVADGHLESATAAQLLRQSVLRLCGGPV